MRQMRRYIATLGLLAGFASGPALSASLSTDVTVNLGSSLSLFCFEEVDVNLSSETYLSAVSRNRSRPMPSITRNARVRSGDLFVQGGRRFRRQGRYRLRNRVNLELGSVCAYRAIGGSNGARVQVELLEDRLETSGGAYITVDRVRARDTDQEGPWRRQFRIQPADLGIGVVRGIDVRMRLSLQNATEPGLYSSPVDGTFRITVLGNP